MPLGKYYCDYCEKEFQDTSTARKRHLQSSHHQRSKALWYHSFKDPNQIQSDPFPIGLCNRFLSTGFCQYGDSCKYFHPKQYFQNTGPQVPRFTENISSATIPENQLFGGGPLHGGVVRDFSLGNLPPSLTPPPEGGSPPLPFLDWG